MPPLRPAAPPPRRHRRWRTLSTARGAFVLPWRPAALKHLLRAEGLAPADLAVGGPSSTRALARDLFLLGLEDELACGAAPARRHSPISILARELLALMETAHVHHRH